MPIISIMNRKGGSGKSTLAIQIAGWFASTGGRVMVGDSDRQQSFGHWLQRRSPSLAAIESWPNGAGTVYRSQAEATHVVIDTPGGIYGLELATQLVRSDAIVVPVGPSVFDLETSMDFLQEIEQHPRIISGQCRVAVVGMRWPLELLLARDNNLIPQPLPMLTAIAESHMYRHCLDEGRTVFDTPGLAHGNDLAQWQPLLTWLTELPQTGHRHAKSKLGRSPSIVPPRPSTRFASRPAPRATGTERPQQMRSPESFVETLPPNGIDLEELKAVQFKQRLQFSLDTGQASKLRPIDSNVSVTLTTPHQTPAVSSPPPPPAENSGSSWLSRFFRPR
jgi:chromosome partitioning protein